MCYPNNYNSEQSDCVTSESEYQPESSSSSSSSSSLEPNVESSIEAEETINCSVGETRMLSDTNNCSEVINKSITSNSIHDSQKDFCPFCFEDVTHFSRHLIRKHYDQEMVKKILSMPIKSVERRDAIIMLRRQGNFTLSREQNIIKPIRKPVGKNIRIDNINYLMCKYCFGVVRSNYLWRHRKKCKADLRKLPKRFGHRSDAQTFLVSRGCLGNYLAKSRVSEVFKIIRADSIGLAAKSDGLICLYGESLLGKHKSRQMYTVISQKMRKMAKLLLSLRTTTTLTNFIDMLKPEFYNYILAAVKIIAGYDHNSLTFRSPSVALQLGTELKLMCQIGKKAITTKNPVIRIIENSETKRKQISDLHEMISSHWCSDIGSLAHKVRNEKKFENPKLLPTAEDVSLFNKYTSSLASLAYESLKNNEHVEDNYNILVKCTLALLLLFNRERMEEIQFLDIDSYERPYAVTNRAEMLSCLSEFEQSFSKIFKRIVVFGKGSKLVPILFSKTTQKYADLIILMRRTTNLVAKENKYLFAISGSTKWLSGYSVVQKLASECGAHRPDILTSTRFRKQIATILQLMNFDKDELHQVAKFMGHTEKTYIEFYRLTENTYQTAKVAKLLLLLESGKGAEFKGKSLDEVVLDDDFLTEEIDDDKQEPSTSGFQAEKLSTSDQDENVLEEIEVSTSKQNTIKGKRWKGKASKGRVKWNPKDKEAVLNEFKLHIKNKIAPKKNEVLQFIKEHKNLKKNDWVRIKTLVYNTYRVK